MSIKQHGGIFGRNPTFNEVSAGAGTFSTVTTTGNISTDGNVNTDTINEKTSATGVTVDGVLLKDNDIEATDGTFSTVTTTGDISTDSNVNTDTINEKTSAAGVTVDGVLLKDNDIEATDGTFSGGVYLGGTAAVNYLDEYEEGTYTPLIKDTGASSTTFDNDLTYTKIGRMVYVYGRIQVTAETLGSTPTHLYINLPVTQSGTRSQGSVYLYNANSDNGNQFVVWVLNADADGVRFVDPTNNAVTYSDNTEIVVGTNLTFSFMYEAAA